MSSKAIPKAVAAALLLAGSLLSGSASATGIISQFTFDDATVGVSTFPFNNEVTASGVTISQLTQVGLSGSPGFFVDDTNNLGDTILKAHRLAPFRIAIINPPVPTDDYIAFTITPGPEPVSLSSVAIDAAISINNSGGGLTLRTAVFFDVNNSGTFTQVGDTISITEMDSSVFSGFQTLTFATDAVTALQNLTDPVEIRIAFGDNSTAGTSLKEHYIRNIVATGEVAEPAAPVYDGMFVRFEDEFNATLDTDVWTIRQDRPNVEVSGGNLRLFTTGSSEDWTTGWVYAPKFTQRYGYYEARYRIGAASGLNNAFWLNTPVELVHEPSGLLQTIDRMEIDINETHYPSRLTYGTHNWDASPKYKIGGSQIVDPVVLSDDYHTYGLLWSEDNTQTFYWNDDPVFTINVDDMNAMENLIPMELIFSTLVASFAGTPDEVNLPGSSMDIDHVRVYQRPGWLGTNNGDVSDAGNWGPFGIPGTDGAALFNRPTSSSNIDINSDWALRELYFEGDDTPAFTFGGSGAILLGDVSTPEGRGGISMNYDVASSQTITNAIVAQRDIQIGNYSRQPDAHLVLSGGLDAADPGTELFIGGFGPIDVQGTISNQFQDVTKFMDSEVWLRSANEFTGEFEARGGVVVVTADEALGATGPTARGFIRAASTLAFAEGIDYTSPKEILLNGDGYPGRSAALEVHDGSEVSFSGDLRLPNNSSVSSGQNGGSLTLNGDVKAWGSNTRSLRMSGNGTITVNGSLDGTVGGGIGDIIKDGSGTLVISSASNSYVGDTHVTSGTLIVNGATPSQGTVIVSDGARLEGLGTIGGDVALSSGAVIAPGTSAPAKIQLISSADARVRQSEPNSSYPTVEWLGVGPISATDSFRGFLAFNLADTGIDFGALTAVSLLVTGTANDATSVASNTTIELHSLADDFTNGVASWNNKEPGSPWTTPGGDIEDLLATVQGVNPDLFANGSQLLFESPSLTNAVTQAITGGSTLPMVLKSDLEGQSLRSFIWVGRANSSSPPRLNLELTALDQATLTINGNLTVDAGATLEMQLAGPALHDRINVGGLLQAGGLLQITLEGSYTPTEGDTFQLLNFATFDGSFDDVQLPALPTGLLWNSSNLTTTGQLQVEATSSTPDWMELID